MGVNGLWTVIQPCARPTNLATLNRKRLAIDASIWIYQFLKAVRDKEGNALRNSHVVGFFRRICKLLWFGIKPVFVFDGGAPALKRQTITSRKRRRDGRREDAVRTAGKLLAVQMQRIAEEEGEKRRRQLELEKEGFRPIEVEEPVEELPAADQFVYVEELGMSQKERQQNRKFYKQDAYHLPELTTSIEGMGKPEDPRIMSVEELEEYARQFQSGEDINLYDFSKIDFEGDFFNSLPPADRYNILNAARIRSRLRMGLSKEQLDDMFPDRMAFSKFQIERVKERNHLTQRLMKEAGMQGTDLTLGVNGRIAGEKDREYILVKNAGAEGGWALGVVSKERDVGEMHKPIDVDALEFQYQTKNDDEEWEDNDDFEDVPIEGLNRLPKVSQPTRRQLYDSAVQDDQHSGMMVDEDDDSLFVQDPFAAVDDLFEPSKGDQIAEDEEEDTNRAIALSLKNQHRGGTLAQEDDEADFEDVPVPQWTQKAVEQPKPVTSMSGSMIAHIVNNRANAATSAVRKRRRSDASDDSDVDLRAAVSAARKKKTVPPKPKVAPNFSNVKNPFDGPLPFEKLDWRSSIFGKKPEKPVPEDPLRERESVAEEAENDLGGGFVVEVEGDEAERTQGAEESRPLPPWMQSEADIRDSMKAQRELEKKINEEDREAELEEEEQRRKEAIIEIPSSNEDSDVEIVEAPAPKPLKSSAAPAQNRLSAATLAKLSPPVSSIDAVADDVISVHPLDTFAEDSAVEEARTSHASDGKWLHTQTNDVQHNDEKARSPEPAFEDISTTPSQLDKADIAAAELDKELFGDDNEASVADVEMLVNDEGTAGDEFSDPEDEELFVQMAEEAEEHARFASQLNNKSERENQEAYEKELKALRSQQKKDRRDADEVSQIMVTECQALLRLFGIPYITAPMEAEAQCAELVRLGLVDGIVTDDSDTFLFGGTRVYKNMFNSNKFVECYLGSDLEQELSLSREQLISIAQLLGSDYTEGLPGVGPVNAVEILSEFPGRDGLTAFRDWWQDVQINNRPKDADKGSTFRRKFRKSQGTKLFLPVGFPNPAVFDAYFNPEVDNTEEPFQWGVPDVDGLRRFLMSTIGWSQERTDEVLVPVIRDMNRRETEGTQTNITRYFEGGVGIGAKEAFAPRQRVVPSKRMAEAVNKLRAKGVVDSLAEGDVEAGSEVGEGNKRRKRKARNTVTVEENDDSGDFAEGASDGHEDGNQETSRRKGKGRAKAKKAWA
ncbi:uncharacterized protein BCR38DRAFT_453490 [Pseudomassariella vexata]|uniref:PIN domain-like protein n=1 Tax=Pseudomassariella vexata TaxID=1141098 RepID=A0A1Y2D5N1_9PEZI|nr:uncharacterized protein BCR38DRAFT_453490 [Pseudomassariella vexata]ORY54560.1 hypothetical protein BCR38DRAFT_453490 [Pseudomassariella vexata]